MIKFRKVPKEEKKAKENPLRSVVKAFSWRIIASLTTFLIVFVIFKRYSDKTFDEVFQTASFVAIVEFFSKIIFYYFHERLWTNISWGKTWKRNYWQRNAWKKLYRQKHNKPI
ncbi:MAG: DUF2061 domain-containing protein [Bacteroidales bacterium]